MILTFLVDVDEDYIIMHSDPGSNGEPRKRILVVDDDELILEALEIALSQEGFEVMAVGDGAGLVKKVSRFKPDLILLDVLLESLDGRDVARELKGNGETRGVPIILISAHLSAGKSVRECGADDFLAKPFDMDELYFRIKKLLF